MGKGTNPYDPPSFFGPGAREGSNSTAPMARQDERERGAASTKELASRLKALRSDEPDEDQLKEGLANHPGREARVRELWSEYGQMSARARYGLSFPAFCHAVLSEPAEAPPQIDPLATFSARDENDVETALNWARRFGGFASPVEPAASPKAQTFATTSGPPALNPEQAEVEKALARARCFTKPA